MCASYPAADVAQELPEGYRFVHMGLLAWITRPDQDFKRIRAPFLALEALFCFRLDATDLSSQQFSVKSLYAWGPTTSQYGGLCTKSPLKEAIQGAYTFTPEDLQMIVRRRRDNRNCSRDLRLPSSSSTSSGSHINDE